jgi:geranylgeranyl reductase family protein
MRRCQVLVIGGGPAGSTCAWMLRRAGLDVIVVDKKRFPRDKVCAGWVTPAVFRTLELDPEEYAAGRVLQPLSGFRTSMLGGREIQTDFDETVSFGIRRCEFDHFLLDRSGAERIEGVAVHEFERRNGRWIVNGDIEADVLIGAGGHFCPVARHVGAKLGAAETVVAAHEIEFVMDDAQRAVCAIDPRVPELFFCPDLLGYGWVFRKDNVLNVGLGREDSHQLTRHVQDFSEFLRARGKIPDRLPFKFKGHAYLLYGHAKRCLSGEAALLVGDAAGLAYLQSGEGIRPAVESAVMAAETIIAADGIYDQLTLGLFEDRIVERFGTREVSGDPAPWLPQPLRHGLARGAMASRWFARHVLLNRWFLHRDQPALIASGI